MMASGTSVVLQKEQLMYEDDPFIQAAPIQPEIFLSIKKKTGNDRMVLGIKRIYEKASITDGKRVLIDGLWPRGIRRSTANIDAWIKDVAPSKDLRLWFAHDPKKWMGFKKRYERELQKNKALNHLVELAKKNDITLLYASQDEKHNNAVVLMDVLKKKVKLKKSQSN